MKGAQLEAQICGQQKDLLRQAADIEGCLVSEFVVNAAQEAAEQRLLTLGGAESRSFVDALLRPPEPNERLRQAAGRHRKPQGV